MAGKKNWQDINLCIGLCNNQDYVPSEFFWSFLNMLRPKNFTVVRGQARLKAVSLNAIVKEAFKRKAEKLLLLDVDQTFSYETIAQLLSRNLPIVSGLTYLKQPPYAPIAGWRKGKHAYNSEGKLWKLNYAKFPDNDNHLVEVDWTSVGCLMIDMEVFNKIYFPCFKEKWDNEEGDRSEGHDVQFCRNVKKAGYKIYVDTLVQCGHIGQRVVCDTYVDAYHGSNMFDKEYQVLKEHAQEKLYWDRVHSREALFYGDRNYGAEWDYIVSQIPKKSSVAEVGCGRGFLLKRIQEEKKCDCYGYDLSSVAIEHIKNRGIDGEVHDFRKPQPNGRMFDCVVASHLLEHMEDEDSLSR